jgi:hypothetical protein
MNRIRTWLWEIPNGKPEGSHGEIVEGDLGHGEPAEAEIEAFRGKTRSEHDHVENDI